MKTVGVLSFANHCLWLLLWTALTMTVTSALDDAVFDTNTFQYTLSSTVLPKPISDHTASLVNQTVYLAGGCDSVDGNVFNISSANFACHSISSDFFAYDLVSQSLTTLPQLPTPRYRHAAVAVNQQIWLLGGRDIDDVLITTVEAFDIPSRVWKSFDLPTELQSSDNAGFAASSQAYFLAGYNQDYDFLDYMIAIDTERTWPNTTLQYTTKASLLVPRGDFAVAVNDKETYVVVSGGYGTTNAFCAPLNSTEYYNITQDTWTMRADLNLARSDMVSVELANQIIVIGGERQIENICQIQAVEPGEQTIPINDVEVFHVDDNNWQELPDFPNHRFRWAAVAIDSEQTLYTFGGQLAYDESCLCYPTTNEIGIYVLAPDDTNKGTATNPSLSTSTSKSSSLSTWSVCTITIFGTITFLFNGLQ